MLRYQVYERARYYPVLFFNLGKNFECPFCRWRFRRLCPAGFDYPILKEARVVGASYHLNDVCPRCQSNARERLLYLYLKQNTDFFSGNKSVLHIAPEPNLAKVLQQAPKILYVSGDLFEANVMTRFDVMQMPFRAETFDVIICSHVLEHVSNDISAMSDLHRVLKFGGWAVLQVPIAMALVKTREDATATTEQQRIELFGQRDHVRLYSERDYIDRLQSVGFNVRKESFCNQLSKADVVRYALIPEESVFICSK